MTLEDIPEMVEDWRRGELRLEDVYFLCLYLFEHHEARVVLSKLPRELQERVDARLRSDWDNDTPPEDCFIFNSGSGEHPATKTIVERARRWIAEHPGELREDPGSDEPTR
jgi:hypothetical protein